MLIKSFRKFIFTTRKVKNKLIVFQILDSHSKTPLERRPPSLREALLVANFVPVRIDVRALAQQDLPKSSFEKLGGVDAEQRRGLDELGAELLGQLHAFCCGEKC